MAKPHSSDRAMHNGPALPSGPCSCGANFLLTPWGLHEEEPGCILADAGDDGKPSLILVDEDRRLPDQAASDIAEHIVTLHNAARKQLVYVCTGCGWLAFDPIADLAVLQAQGGRSCCPERKMLPHSLPLLRLKREHLNAAQDVIRERAVHLAKATLKPGDKIRVQRCGNSRGNVYTFAGWLGPWIVSRSGVDDLCPSCILTVNGQWVDWSMSPDMWKRLGPGEPEWKREARQIRKVAEPLDEGEIPY